MHGEVRRLLDRLHGEIAGRLDDDRPLPTDPSDHRRPILVIMATTGLAFLPPATRSAPQRLLATALRLSLVTGGVVEVIGFHGACQLAVGFIGEGRIAQPPAPAIARPVMHPQLSRNTSRGTRQAQEKCREDPVGEGALAAIQERAREVIEGALALLLFTAVAFQAGLVVVGAPRTDVVALTPRTLEGPIFPS